ncbi:MAG: dipeptide epimerase, partial [Burkholderiaceae bacterium]
MKTALTVTSRNWELKEAFVISRQTFTRCEVIVVHLECDGHLGRGEGKGVLYHGETPATLREQIEAIRGEIAAGAGRRELLDLLPAGGARNAIDAALWDLEAKRTGVPVWRLAGVEPARPIVSTATIGIRDLDGYEARARSLSSHPWLKIKVSNDRPLDAIAAVRRGASSARLVVDANQ